MTKPWLILMSDELNKIESEDDIAHRRNLLRQEVKALRRLAKTAKRLRQLGYNKEGVARQMKLPLDDIEVLLEDEDCGLELP